MDNKIEEAREISIRYNFPLIERWDGDKAFWHVWHQPSLIWFITYIEYIERIINIELRKPQEEKQERFCLMKPVMQKFKINAAWKKANAARKKTYTAWAKADAAWVKPDATRKKKKIYNAWAKADAAWEEAYAAWKIQNHDIIISAHEKECPNCKWDGEKLLQFCK